MLDDYQVALVSDIFGPFAFHYTDASRLESILKQGLLPQVWSGIDNYGDEFKSRPDHVYFYLGGDGDNPPFPSSIVCPQDPVILQVSLQCLFPCQINPDEDAFVGCAALQARDYGIEPPNLIEFSDYGQWAEHVCLGDDNADLTLDALGQTSTFAYCGSVSPDFISVVNHVRMTV